MCFLQSEDGVTRLNPQQQGIQRKSVPVQFRLRFSPLRHIENDILVAIAACLLVSSARAFATLLGGNVKGKGNGNGNHMATVILTINEDDVDGQKTC